MIGLIVLGLAFLFFIVVAFFAAKTWHVGHVVSMVFLFLVTLAMLFMTATLMRTHDEYRPKYRQAINDLESQEDRTRTLTYGAGSAPAGEGSLVGERKLAKVEMAARGRVWRNVRHRITAPGGPIQLDMRNWDNNGCLRVGQEDVEGDIEPVPDEEVSGTEDGGAAVDVEADPAAGAAAVASSHGIVKGQYIFVFNEFPISLMTATEKEYYFSELGEGEDSFAEKDKESKLCRVPFAYLGKFLVQDANPNMLTVVPAGPLTPGQAKQLENPATWVLYERLPNDSHDIFAGVDPAKLANLVPLNRLGASVQTNEAAHQRMLSEFVNDGKELTGPASDFRVRQPVKFLKDHEVTVNLVVDADLPPTDKPFDVYGRAQVKSLMQDEPVTKFVKDQVAVFDGATVKKLEANGTVQRDGKPTYSRQLRDFQFMLEEHQDRFAKVTREKEAVETQVQELAESLQGLQEQIDKHRVELQQLQADQKGFEVEKEQLQEFKQLLESRLEMLNGEVDALL